MKRFLALAATAAAASIPTAAIAATSGTLRGEFTVPYECSITVPATQTMVVSGTTATKTGAAWSLSQNGDTDYSVTTLAITEPAAATTTGLITVKRNDTSTLVAADGIGSPDATGTISGIVVESGTVDFQQSETVHAVFPQGSYAVQTVLSCAENAGGGEF